MTEHHTEYHYSNAAATHDAAYLLDPVKEIVNSLLINDKRIFELGCGNGCNTHEMAKLGYQMTAVDTSESGIRAAQDAYPNCHFEQGSAYDDLASRFGQFNCVVSLEVVEHVFAPRDYANTVFKLLNDGGTAIISTPYHGYLKNLAIAVSNKFDQHVDPLWDGGHIKFWSEHTLSTLLTEAGFRNITFKRVGRVPALAKSMIAIAKK